MTEDDCFAASNGCLTCSAGSGDFLHFPLPFFSLLPSLSTVFSCVNTSVHSFVPLEWAQGFCWVGWRWPLWEGWPFELRPHHATSRCYQRTERSSVLTFSAALTIQWLAANMTLHDLEFHNKISPYFSLIVTAVISMDVCYSFFQCDFFAFYNHF